MDIKGAYLNANLDEEIFMAQLPGFSVLERKTMHVNFSKMKQSGRRWYKCICEAFSILQFVRCGVEHCVFFKWIGLSFIVVMVAMNDLTLASNSAHLLSWNQGSAQCKVANSRWQIWWHTLALGIKVKCNHWELTISLLQCGVHDTISCPVQSHGCQHCKCSMELDLHLSTRP